LNIFLVLTEELSTQIDYIESINDCLMSE